MIDITIRFPDKGPGDDVITEDEVRTWGETILKPMASFTGIECQIIEVATVTPMSE